MLAAQEAAVIVVRQVGQLAEQVGLVVVVLEVVQTHQILLV
jgi:hypothetical protein